MNAVFKVIAGAAMALAGAAAAPAVGQDGPVNWGERTFTSIRGEAIAGEAFAGRVVLLVNTASRCAFTPQYDGLEALWARYERRGLTVLGIPSNDFGGQEPGTNRQIAEFCVSTFGVSFPMLAKARVTGGDAHELFRWARQAGGRQAVPGWNFHKVLIGRDGRFVAGFPSFTEPTAQPVVQAVEKALSSVPGF